MSPDRREVLKTVGAGLVLATVPTSSFSQERTAMYGLIGRATAVSGQRENLIALMLEGISGMPGCLSYVVARDPADADGLWITEVWDSADSHKASLKLPAVQATIARARPLLARFDSHQETEPVGGHGLAGR